MKLLLKDIFIKIKKSYGRFLSLLFIVSLGVGFFAGLRTTSDDMLLTADKYFDDYKLMDYQIVSTYGLTDEDVKAIKKLKKASTIVPSYSVDIVIDGESVRVHAIEDKVNIINLKKGRHPKNNNECIAEYKKYKLNDVINIQNENLKIEKCTIVGLAESVLYIGPQKGISSAGNGNLQSFVFINKNNFNYEYYTEIYILNNSAKKLYSYSNKYLEKVGLLKKELESIKEIRETVRYEEIYEKINNEINKNKDKVNNEKETNGNKLRSTKRKLDETNNILTKTSQELLMSENKLHSEKEKNELLIKNGKNELENNKAIYNSSLNSYELTNDTLISTIDTLIIQISNIQKQLNLLTEGTSEYISLKSQFDLLQDQYNKLNTLKTAKEQIDSKEKELLNNEQNLKTVFAENLYKIEKGKAELLINKGKLEDGYNIYYKALNTYNIKIKEAENKIESAEKELLNLEKPKWYLLDRNDSIGYSIFEENATKVDAIAKVFPLFFLFVVALISLNTMTRMIEEERGEIGTLAGLGYTNKRIIFGYLIYILLATIFGVSFGLATGFNILPRAIYSIYTANYKLPSLIVPIKPVTFILTTLIAFILMSFVTIYVSYLELKDAPANLLRPKAPKEGKKVFIEKINFIWKRLNFSQKVTIRNIFRYKKRIIMTVTGIAGCTALLLTGFGIKDSLSSIVKLQYGEIIKYDAAITYKEPQKTINSNIENINKINDSILVNQELYTFKANDLKNNVYLMTVSDNKDINKFIELRSMTKNKVINVSNDGVLITKKIAKLLNIGPKDNIKIRDSNNNLYILRVDDVIENYIWHYIYISDDYYKKVFNKDISYDMVLTKINNKDIDLVAKDLLKDNNIGSINYMRDNYKIFYQMLDGLNNVVLLMILSACLLAIIVLYNLTTININERKREIATLKVLGFKDKEVSNYVYREIFLLTLIGIIFGIALGILLHKYVMVTAETDNVMFKDIIKYRSYFYAFILTLIFSKIVELFTHFKLKTIDMIESLKSIE